MFLQLLMSIFILNFYSGSIMSTKKSRKHLVRVGCKKFAIIMKNIRADFIKNLIF